MVEFFPNEQNFIKTLITHPCARPWYIWVETFIPAFVKLLLMVGLFDIEDAIRGHGEKIAGEGKGKKGKRHTPRIKTTGQKTTIQTYAAKGLKTLLVVTSPLEAIGFLWLLYSAVDEFFYDWQTLLELSDFCKSPIESGPLQRSTGPGFRSLVVGGIPVILPILNQNRAGWPSLPIGASLPEGVYSASFALTIRAPLNGFTNIWVQIFTPGAFGPDITRSEGISMAPNEEGSINVRHSFWYPIIGGGSITWEIGGETIPAGVEVVKGHFTCHRTG